MSTVHAMLGAYMGALPPGPPPYPGVAALLAARVAADPAGPLLTFYDDATGERTELSATTLDNWVAKTANLLVDGVGVAPSDQVGVLLPLHWQTAVVLLAVWSTGAGVRWYRTPSGAGPAEAAVAAVGDPEIATGPLAAAFVNEDTLADAPTAGEVIGLSLRPLAGRLSQPHPGVTDYAEEVPGYGDHFQAPEPEPEQADLVRLAAATAVRWQVRERERLLCADALDTAEGLLAGLLVPLAATASAVLCRNLDADALPHRVATERVTAACGWVTEETVSLPSVRRLTL